MKREDVDRRVHRFFVAGMIALGVICFVVALMAALSGGFHG